MLTGKRNSVVVAVALALAGCGGSGNGNGGGGAEGGSSQLRESNPRIKSISYDVGQDRSADLIQTWFYDSSGRVVRIESENLTDSTAVTSTTQYEYSAEGLVRVSESDSGDERTYSYQNGRVASVTRSDGEVKTYRYNSAGRLIEHTQNRPYCDDFELAADASTGSATFRYSYDGGRISSIATSDDTYSIDITYGAGNRINRIVSTESCGSETTLVEETTLNYDSQGRAQSVEVAAFTEPGGLLDFNDQTTLTRDDLGRVIVREETDLLTNTVLERLERTFNTSGFPASDSIAFNSQSAFFARQNTTATYTYEEGRCVISYSADPSISALLDAVLPLSSFSEEAALLCGYPLDTGLF